MSQENKNVKNNIETFLKPELAAPLTPSILNGIQLTETINKVSLELLLNYNKIEDTDKKKLVSLSKKLSKSNNLNVKYTNENNCGRVFCSLGSSIFSKNIRHTLYTSYTDIDIINSGYNILYNICISNNIESKYIKQYIDNRNNILPIIADNCECSIELVKNLFLMILHGGQVKTWCKKNNIKVEAVKDNFLTKLIDNITNISTIIVKNNPILSTNSKNDGAIVAKYLQYYENLILETVYLYCVKNGYIKNNNCSLAFDGILILTEYYNDNLLIELSDEVYLKTGFKLQFKNKPMIDGFTMEYLENNQTLSKDEQVKKTNDIITNTNTNTNKNILDFDITKPLNSSDVAHNFKSMYNHLFIFQNNKLYFFNEVFWKAEEKGQLITLNNFITDVYYKDLSLLVQNFQNQVTNNSQIDKDDKIVILTHINKFSFNLLELLNYDRRQKYINEILCKLHNDKIKFDENPYLFAFDNKVFDLTICQFIDPKPEQYISLTTGYDYIIEDESDELIDELDSIIDTIFYQPELKKLYLTILSTGLDGIPLEKFVIANGRGGNGKGVLNELAKSTIGNYAYVLPSNILSGPLKTGSNPELANMNNKRFVISREPDSSLKFNCATIKEITGGEALNARVNYSNDTNVNLKLTFVDECNDKPQLNEVNDALARRILDIPFKSSFVSKDVYDELEENEKTHTFLINDFYKTLEFKNKFRQPLFLLLVKYYKEFYDNKRNLPITAEVRNRGNEYMAKSDEFLSWFNNEFEKTKSKSDNIKLKAVYDCFKNSDFFTNMTKVQKRQNNYQNFIEKIQNNMFLKKFLIQIKETYIITNYTIKKGDTKNDSDTDDESVCGLDA